MGYAWVVCDALMGLHGLRMGFVCCTHGLARACTGCAWPVCDVLMGLHGLYMSFLWCAPGLTLAVRGLCVVRSWACMGYAWALCDALMGCAWALRGVRNRDCMGCTELCVHFDGLCTELMPA
eukprot:364844-Chlamydomonas_euryale.AAC.3